MLRLLPVVVLLFMVGVMLCSIGCGNRVHYSNVFGDYTLSDADVQYSELFQMKPSQYRQFLSFRDGWWRADVRKMREMGITVPELCERYCRLTSIKVPFPLLIDYQLLAEHV